MSETEANTVRVDPSSTEPNDGVEPKALLKKGGIFGAAAFVVGLVLTAVLGGLDDGDEVVMLDQEVLTVSDLEAEQEFTLGMFETTMWLYHSAHQAALEATLSGPAVLDGEVGSAEMLVEADGILLVVPPLVLAAAGYVLVDRLGAGEAGQAAKRGAAVAAGYLPMAVLTGYLGTLVFGQDFADETLWQIEMTVATNDSVIFTGLSYPILFGALGGYIAYSQRDSPEAGRPTPESADPVPAERSPSDANTTTANRSADGADGSARNRESPPEQSS